MTEPAGPLSNVDEEAIVRAFEADPLTLDDTTLDALVGELRRRRNAFLAQEAAKSLAKKAPKAKPSAVPTEQQAVLDKPPSELTIEDIFGDEE